MADAPRAELGRQPADQQDHERAPARLRLRAEGLPARGAARHPPLRRDAPLHPGAVGVDGHPRRGGPRAAPRPRRREEQVRPRARGPGHPRPDQRQVPRQLFHAPDPGLRQGRHRLVPRGLPLPGVDGPHEVLRRLQHHRQPVLHPLGAVRAGRVPVHLHRAARGDHDPDLLRAAREADVRRARAVQAAARLRRIPARDVRGA